MNQNQPQQQHNVMYSRQVTMNLRRFLQSQQQRQLHEDDCGPSINTGSRQDDNTVISSDGIVGSEWKLIAPIGEGSFGQIFHAESVKTGEVIGN
jgi:hypothetical protein